MENVRGRPNTMRTGTNPFEYPAGLSGARISVDRRTGITHDVAHAMAVRFRLPGRGDPEPEPRRLAAVCVWAAALGAGGAILVVPLLFDLFLTAGGWYQPTLLGVGAIGVSATIGAFASIHRRRLPWIMLTVGTLALLVAMVSTLVRP